MGKEESAASTALQLLYRAGRARRGAGSVRRRCRTSGAPAALLCTITGLAVPNPVAITMFQRPLANFMSICP